MDSQDDIFLNAREITDPGLRAAYLNEACGTDAVLRGRVEAMLRHAAAAEDFFGPKGTVVFGSGEPKLTEGPGAVIGRYKLLQKIGEGGMGVVYLAEQRQPVVRKVALKIIKLGMDTWQVIARFEAERQALALMDHPNIARVLDAGTTVTGRPYFVMDLVQGLPITQFCDEGSLSTRERLDLFVDVCSAVQHAHQKGIIHRDLKPSNILVTLHGDRPVPKVIDFGVAKATQGRLTERTLFTQFQQLIGTPAYMSPEQTSLSGLDVDTRSDIYALGVLLYELLTGRTPFDGKELMQAGLDEMRRTLREKEPPRPSARLSTLAGGDLTTAAQQRRTVPLKLIHQVRGDLDWIVMKCLEKDRARRYESANGLAMDLQRHWNSEPVVARPPSAIYRAQKAIRRNRVAFAAAGAVTAALVIGLTVSLWFLAREKAARGRAVAAEREQARLRGVAEMNRRQAEANWSADRALLLRRDNDLAGAEAMFRQAFADSRSGWPDAPAMWERSLGGLVDVLLRRTNFVDAERILNEVLGPSLVVSPGNVGLIQIRAEFFARRGRWNEAAADAAKTVELDPTNYWRYHTLAPLLVAGQEPDGYRRLCQKIVARFADTRNPLAAEAMAKSCLLLPASGADPQTVSNLARLAVASRVNDPANLAIFRFTEGLTEYRQGHFASAAECIQKSLTTTSNVYAHIEAYAVLAMAQHQLGQAETAKATLAQGLKLQEKESRRLESGDLTFDWRAWVRGRVLMKEAGAVIAGAAGEK